MMTREQNFKKFQMSELEIHENIYACVAPADTEATEFREKILDIEMYFRVYLNKPDLFDNLSQHSFRVPAKMMTEELRKVALENTKRTLEIKSMAEILGIPKGFGPDMDVVTTPTSTFGATALAFPDIFREYCEQHHTKNLFIIPSSVHELIILDNDGAIDPGLLAPMIQSVNDTELEPEDILANHPYFYSYETNEITY